MLVQHRNINRENPVSNPFAAISKLGQVRSLFVANSTDENLATDSCEYVNE